MWLYILLALACPAVAILATLLADRGKLNGARRYLIQCFPWVLAACEAVMTIALLKILFGEVPNGIMISYAVAAAVYGVFVGNRVSGDIYSNHLRRADSKNSVSATSSSGKEKNMALNYSKIDAALNVVLQDQRNPDSKEINVFISTNAVPDNGQAAYLARLGVTNPSNQTTIFTATLSTNEIEALSNQPWVKYLRGSVQMRPA